MAAVLRWSKALRDLFFKRKDFEEQMTKFIDDKYKIKKVIYNARKLGYIDIRDIFKVSSDVQDEIMKNYFTELVSHLPEMDDKALFIAQHINSKMTYDSDSDRFGKAEYWADPYTIFNSWRDDCDGYAVLICYAWGLVGIPRFRRFVFAGDVFDTNGNYAGGHAYAVYLREEDQEFYPMEGSFYPKICSSNYKLNIPLRKNKYYGNVWFATNEETSYNGEAFLTGTK